MNYSELQNIVEHLTENKLAEVHARMGVGYTVIVRIHGYLAVARL